MTLKYEYSITEIPKMGYRYNILIYKDFISYRKIEKLRIYPTILKASEAALRNIKKLQK